MIEFLLVVSVNLFDNIGWIGIIGLLVFFIDVCIVDQQGNVLGYNQFGELQVKGLQVMKGYYNWLDEINKIFVNGWLCIGDIVMFDEDGFMQIVDC